MPVLRVATTDTTHGESNTYTLFPEGNTVVLRLEVLSTPASEPGLMYIFIRSFLPNGTSASTKTCIAELNAVCQLLQIHVHPERTLKDIPMPVLRVALPILLMENQIRMLHRRTTLLFYNRKHCVYLCLEQELSVYLHP